MVTRRLLSLPVILSLAALAPLSSRPAGATDYTIAGTVRRVGVQPGQLVDAGQVLVEVA